MAGRVVEKVVRPSPIASGVARALGTAAPRSIVKRTLIKNGKPLASGFLRRR